MNRLARLVAEVLGPDPPVAVELHDGTVVGRADAAARLVIRSPNVLRRLLTAPGELGFARAYVAGELDIDGDLYAALRLREHFAGRRLQPKQWLAAARIVTSAGLRPLSPPPEEAHLGGRRHTRERDFAAIRHHYDVSNRFYRLVLGPSLTYSCAVWDDPAGTLEDAQAAKHELVCTKLGLQEGMRLLDVGCGWGGMLLHAAVHHGVSAVGVTLSARQAEFARERVRDAGVADRVEVRLADYRDLGDERFDAISSIGMFEHVGLANLRLYFRRLFGLLDPGGRLLNHGIARPRNIRARFRRRGFVDRYVFPDGELHELGSVVSTMQAGGFEPRNTESLREHYALTLRAWVANLESSWAEAVSEVGAARARIWRLYMFGSALGFEAGRLQVHQVLAVRAHGGVSGMPLRPGTWARESAGQQQV